MVTVLPKYGENEVKNAKNPILSSLKAL